MTKKQLQKQLLDQINEIKAEAKGKQVKSARFTVGASALGENGSICGYFSTYHHDKADSYGDVIAPGCFAETIKERERSGNPFPLCYNHSFDHIIGAVTFIEERPQGAFMKAVLFDTEEAQHVRELIKSNVLFGLSFAYEVLESGRVTLQDGSKANELRKLQLFEISITPIPANSRAVITDVKASKTLHQRKDALLDHIQKLRR